MNQCNEKELVIEHVNRSYPIVGYYDRGTKTIQAEQTPGAVPFLNVRMMSDYKWQLDGLNDRLRHPEKYEPFEDVQEAVAELQQWLSEHTPD